jgi:serine/threonine protein kinase
VDAASRSPPRVLGRYALYDPIASGGMATVHLGRLLGHVGFERTVAIKRLHPQFAQDPEFVSMFLDEARVVARIRHPNVVPTLDVVAVEGELFIVMEYVQGESLSRLIKTSSSQGSRIPPAYVATIMGGVLHGLHAAHEAKNERGEPLDVVHRDISPQNILVGTDGVARVLDFGVAKAAGRIQTTREGQLKGKLAYMAPEQISGIVGRGTDVYAASVVLWEALTGRRLFSGDNDAHVMKLVLENRIAAPSEHVPDLPPALDALVLRGLSREPADRFATAKEMALALEEALPPVAPSKIGAWVETTASKTLVDRSERIASIESNSSLHAPPAAKSGPGLLPPSATAAAPSARAVEEVHTQLSSGSASTPGRAARTSRPSRSRLLLVAVGGSAVAAALVLAFSLGRGDREAPASSADLPAATSPLPSTPAVAVSEAAPTTSAPSPDVTASTMPSVAAAPAASVARPSPPRWRPPAQKPPAARSPGVDDGTSDRK